MRNQSLQSAVFLLERGAETEMEIPTSGVPWFDRVLCAAAAAAAAAASEQVTEDRSGTFLRAAIGEGHLGEALELIQV